MVYSDEERKFNQEIIVGLIRSELINLTDYNLHLVKWIDGGRNSMLSQPLAQLFKRHIYFTKYDFNNSTLVHTWDILLFFGLWSLQC